MKQKKQIDRFYRMSKALQLVEGIYVASLWAHLNDAYEYFIRDEMIEIENTFYQSSTAITAFSGIGNKAIKTARERLVELGFIKYKVAAIKGQATKTTYYILYPEVYEKWVKGHNYDELRDQKYKEILATTSSIERINDWIDENVTKPVKNKRDSMVQKQKSKGTFANTTKEHLLTSTEHISKPSKEHVIDTLIIDTKQSHNTQTKGKGCVYSSSEYSYLVGKDHKTLLDEIIVYYRNKILEHHPDYLKGKEFDYKRYIGNDDKVENEFEKLEIDIAANLYVCIHGYIDKMEEEILTNQRRFTAAYMFERLLTFHQDDVLTRDFMNRGKRVCKNLFEVVENKHSF